VYDVGGYLTRPSILCLLGMDLRYDMMLWFYSYHRVSKWQVQGGGRPAFG
jgi:hypothetical protein